MSTSATAWSVPRLIQNHGLHQKIIPATVGSGCYSPDDLLSRFNKSTILTVKRSLERFFMYEEHGPVKLPDGQKETPTITVSPNDLATMLMRYPNKSKVGHRYHYYWTSPISAVAPDLLKDFQWHKQLHDANDHPLLDPRGPSLWMGTSGSGTQCHYDVANNIIVQLYGTKRIRCYSPSVGVYNLHVFPDAHPRARKSQVDFDKNDGVSDRFPHSINIPKPTLDVTLRPGDALSIPAFWFHHVENGMIPYEREGDEIGDDEPSVSLNSFALSKPMMVAQQIFQKAGRPLGGDTINSQLAPSLLKALGTTLIRELNVVGAGMEGEFICQYLLEARYHPLVSEHEDEGRKVRDGNLRTQQLLTNEQQQTIKACIQRIMPEFRLLMEGEGTDNDGTGIALLVGLHLLELWAVELVGAQMVAKVWDKALR